MGFVQIALDFGFPPSDTEGSNKKSTSPKMPEINSSLPETVEEQPNKTAVSSGTNHNFTLKPPPPEKILAPHTAIPEVSALTFLEVNRQENTHEIDREKGNPDSIQEGAIETEEDGPIEFDLPEEDILQEPEVSWEKQVSTVYFKNVLQASDDDDDDDEVIEIPLFSQSAAKESQPVAIARLKEKKLPEQESATKNKRGRKRISEMVTEAAFVDIPEDDQLFQKQYYGIGEVSKMFGVNTSLIRFWETEFDIIKPKKNRKGDRLFRPVDIKNLHLIHNLLRLKKYTIQGAKDYLKQNRKKAEKQFEIEQSLRRLRSFLLQMRADLTIP